MMRRALFTGLLSLLALGGSLTPASAAPASVDLDKVALAAKTTACTTGEQEASRAVAFTGSMPAGTGTRRMQMRFVLLQRLGSKGAYQHVDVPGWGGWEKSDPGRPGFVFTKRVESLAAPASYRAQITFRWYDRKGHLQRSAVRTSHACLQPDPRADLVLGGLDIAAKGKDQAIYTLSVSNDGRAAADPFTVTITVDGTVLPALTLGPLAVGERRQGTIVGARCAAGSTVTVTVDAGGVVDESDEADDTVQRPCLIG